MLWKSFPENKPNFTGWAKIVLEDGTVTKGFYYQDRFIFSTSQFNDRTHKVTQFEDRKITDDYLEK